MLLVCVCVFFSFGCCWCLTKGPLPSGATLLPVTSLEDGFPCARDWKGHRSRIEVIPVLRASHLLGLQKSQVTTWGKKLNYSEDSNPLNPQVRKGSIATKAQLHLLLLLFFLLLHAFRMLTANGPSIAAKAMHRLGLQVLPEPSAHCGAE